MAVLLLLGATFLLSCIDAQSVRARHQNMKVRINATGDTIVMKFVRPSAPVRLEGYILGYGSRMFSRQFIQLPENGRTYETEIDAEPKYLVAVQPVQANDVKKTCTGKVDLEKMLHLVITSVSPTAVLLSWGNHLKTPYEGDIRKECLEDGFYTIRHRERNREWIYQTCPTSDMVIDKLKPNTPYEFGVRSNTDGKAGLWSKPLFHSTSMGNKNVKKPVKMRLSPRKPMKADSFFPPRLALHNGTRPRPPSAVGVHSFPGSQGSFGSRSRNDGVRRAQHPPSLSKLLLTSTPSANITASPHASLSPRNGSSPDRTTTAPSGVSATPPIAAGHRNLSLPPQPHGPPPPPEAGSSSPASRNHLYSFSNGLRPPQPFPRSSNSSPTTGMLGGKCPAAPRLICCVHMSRGFWTVQICRSSILADIPTAGRVLV